MFKITRISRFRERIRTIFVCTDGVVRVVKYLCILFQMNAASISAVLN